MWFIQLLATFALLSAATGIFFAFIFFSIKGNKALANRMLSLLLITFSIRIAEIAFYWTRYVSDYPHLYDVSTSMPLLFGVFLFFYIKYSQSEEENISYKFFFHLIPFIIYLLYLAPSYLQSAEFKLAELQNIISADPVYGVELSWSWVYNIHFNNRITNLWNCCIQLHIHYRIRFCSYDYMFTDDIWFNLLYGEKP